MEIFHWFHDGRRVEAWLDETLIERNGRNGGACILYNGHWLTATAAANAVGGSGNESAVLVLPAQRWDLVVY